MAANDVTLSLKRTHALLEQELEKSSLSLETLNRSTETMGQLEHKHSGFDVLLRASKKLIVELDQADKWDRWRIYAGLAIFAFVCLWIIYRRVLRGPVGIGIWVLQSAWKMGRSLGGVESPASIGAPTVSMDEAVSE